MNIKINEFVRFNDGDIGKIIDIKENPDRVIYSQYGEIGLISDIVKHSENILDVLEKEDFVNGCKVYEIESDGVTVYQQTKNSTTDYNWIHKAEIETILSYQQYQNHCYEIR